MATPGEFDLQVHYSASQLKTFTSCERKWYFQKVLGLQDEPSQAADWGKAAHLVLETWAKGDQKMAKYVFDWFVSEGIFMKEDWERIQLGRGTTATLKALHVEYQLYEPFVINGRVRWINGFVDHVADHYVIDHKTTGNARYLPKDGEHAEDIQMALYGYFMCKKMGWRDVTLAHNVVMRKGRPKAFMQKTKTDAKQLDRFWNSKLLPIIGQMEVARDTGAAADVPPTGVENRHCFAYGRPCPFTEVCAKASKGVSDMDLINPPDGTRRKDGDTPNAEKFLKSKMDDETSSFFDRADDVLKEMAIEDDTKDSDES